MNRFIALILIYLCLLPFGLFSEKAQYWQEILLPIGRVQDIQFTFRQEYRFAQSDFKTEAARFSLMSLKKLTKTFDGCINFTFENNRNHNQSDFVRQFRFEFELNPHFKLSQYTEAFFRNRYELLKDDRYPTWIHVFREQHLFVMNVNYKSLISIGIRNEIFYNFNTQKFDQDRFVPLELSFRMKGNHVFRLYFMIRWLKPDQSWNPQFVLGSTLDW